MDLWSRKRPLKASHHLSPAITEVIKALLSESFTVGMGLDVICCVLNFAFILACRMCLQWKWVRFVSICKRRTELKEKQLWQWCVYLNMFIPAAGALSQSQVHPLLGSLPLPGRPLQRQTHAQLERFLPLRVNSSSPLSLFPNFNAVWCHIHFPRQDFVCGLNTQSPNHTYS